MRATTITYLNPAVAVVAGACSWASRSPSGPSSASCSWSPAPTWSTGVVVRSPRPAPSWPARPRAAAPEHDPWPATEGPRPGPTRGVLGGAVIGRPRRARRSPRRAPPPRRPASSRPRSCATFSASRNTWAILPSSARWSSPAPAMPTTNSAGLPFQSIPLGVAHERDRGPPDRRLGLVGAVRDRQPVAHVRRDRLLALVHRVDVDGVDGAAATSSSTGLGDRLVAGRAVPPSTIELSGSRAPDPAASASAGAASPARRTRWSAASSSTISS